MVSDNYIQRVVATKSHLCVGLDPVLDKFPYFILNRAKELYGKNPQGAAYAILEFNKIIIDIVADKVPSVKPQLANYEKYDSYGIEAFWKTVEYARKKGLLVIADAKRGDIGSTSNAYAESFFKNSEDEWASSVAVDALTINPFLGSDGLDPFINLNSKKGNFVLVKTSNQSSGEIQDLVIDNKQITVSETVCDYINSRVKLVGEYGFSNIGAVVGATYPQELSKFRKLLPHSLFLVPGVGYQGGDITQLEAGFDKRGLGSIISCSRAIDYSYESQDVSEIEMKLSISKAVDDFNMRINSMLKSANKCFWED